MVVEYIANESNETMYLSKMTQVNLMLTTQLSVLLLVILQDKQPYGRHTHA